MHSKRGQTAEAESLFEKSFTLLEQGNEFGEAGRVCRAWASILSDQGRRNDAARLLARAAELEKKATPQALKAR